MSRCLFRSAAGVLSIVAWIVIVPAVLAGSVETAGMTPPRVYDPVPLGPRGIHSLLGTWARRTPGIAQMGPAGDPGGFKAKTFWLRDWSDPAQKIAWEVESPGPAEYHATFLINGTPGRKLTLTGPLNALACTVPAGGWQRVDVPGALRLPAGRSVIGVALEGVKGGALQFKSLELVDQRDAGDLARRVEAFKGDVSWMKTAGYGIMVQAGGWSYPSHGDKKPWPGFAEDFDARAFVRKVDEMGGRFLIWSATWSDYLFPAPIRAIGDILPRRVSRRDLIADLIAECKKRKIRFLLYYHLGHSHRDVMTAKGWPADDAPNSVSRAKWLESEEKILREVGLRYAKGLDGVFLDDGVCWYPADFERLGAAIKAGNPERIVAYNPWVAPSCTPFQDFWCGEGFDGRQTPFPLADGVITDGPQKGLQLFGTFIFDGPDWGVRKPDTVVNSPRGWTADRVVKLTRRLERERYSVAFNLLLYEDGTVGPQSYGILTKAAATLGRGGVSAPR